MSFSSAISRAACSSPACMAGSSTGHRGLPILQRRPQPAAAQDRATGPARSGPGECRWVFSPRWTTRLPKRWSGEGQCLVLTSDGITEARDADRVMFGFARMRDTVASAPAGGALQTLLLAQQGFVGDIEQEDDITVIALNRFAPVEGSA